MKLIRKNSAWLLPAALILFILQVALFPFAMGITYAGRADKTAHSLTYTPGVLAWDGNTDINPDGSASLSLFSSVYNNADSGNEKSVAPGTELTNIIRFKNNSTKPVKFTAVLYEIKSADYLPVSSRLGGNGFKDTEKYSLPKSAKGAKTVRAVAGETRAGEITDFDISWLWDFYESDEQDKIDTFLGNKAADGSADDVLLGFYIVVEDENDYGVVEPTLPGTGRAAARGIYGVLTAVSAVAVFVLFADKRKSKNEKNSQNT